VGEGYLVDDSIVRHRPLWCHFNRRDETTSPVVNLSQFILSFPSYVCSYGSVWGYLVSYI
jgi:hypothetical protein